MLVAFSLLALSVSYLIYRHPPVSWIAWLPALRLVTEGPPLEKPTRDDPAESSVRAQGEPLDRKESLEDGSAQEVSSSTTSSPTTPKAVRSSARNDVPIPTFALAEHESSEEEDDLNMPPPSFPALNSAQRAAPPTAVAQSVSKRSFMASPAMAPPPKPSLMAPPPRPPGQGLMPPPSIKASNLRSLAIPSQSLRVPTSGPLPNRGPVPNRGPNGGLSPSAAGAVKTPNARNKVLLSPGHSPLDWANLHQSGNNLSGVPSLVRVTPSMLKYNNGRKGKPAWSSYQGKVYNITPYLPFHPGGEGELRRAAGKDGGKLFMEVHPWVNWDNMLSQTVVGIMVSESQAVEQTAGSLEDMD